MIEVNRNMGDRGQLPRGEEEPPFPLTDSYLFMAFQDLNGARTSNGFGPNPISFQDVQAYCVLTGVSLTPWDVRILRRMDQTYLTAVRMTQPKADKPIIRGARG